MGEPEYENVILDTHPYQCFTDDDRKRDLHGQVQHASARTQEAAGRHAEATPVPGRRVVVCACRRSRWAAGPDWHSTLAMRAYGDAQLINFDTTRGWFFWTFKTEEGGAWSFRDCVKRGWLPEKYDR